MTHNPVTSTDVQAFLAEDIGSGDLTAAIIPAHFSAQAQVITREHAVVCGQAWFNAVFIALDPQTRIVW
ncbi:MAG: nicotinate-nucleotide diphosphorylase, partial [Methylovulum sp.]|nr:nicotinate-nucleotide diphosphorylase [Methylovulum sp.]